MWQLERCEAFDPLASDSLPNLSPRIIMCRYMMHENVISCYNLVLGQVGGLNWLFHFWLLGVGASSGRYSETIPSFINNFSSSPF